MHVCVCDSVCAPPSQSVRVLCKVPDSRTTQTSPARLRRALPGSPVCAQVPGEVLARPRSRTSGRDGATPANRGPGGAAPARLLSMPGTLRGTPSSAAPYLKQGTDLVLLQVSLDPGLLIRRHRETAAAAVQREGRRRPRRGPGQALARLGRPGVAGSARAAGVGCSPAAASAWGAESGSPGTHGAANSHNSEARGQLIHRARPHGRARRGARAGRGVCPPGGGSRARSAGGEREGARCRPGAASVRVRAPLPRPGLGGTQPGFSPACACPARYSLATTPL